MREFVITLSRPETGTWTIGGYWGTVIATAKPDYPGLDLDDCFTELKRGITTYLSRVHPTLKSATFLVFDPTKENPYSWTDHRGYQICMFKLKDDELSLFVGR